MKGNKEVIDALNFALKLELGAVNQYWLHYRRLDDWGYTKMAKKEREESIEEMQHADKLITRIIFLEGFPKMQEIAPMMIGENLKEVLECDLKGEYIAQEFYSKARELCRQRDSILRYTREALIAPIRRLLREDLGTGLALEGLGAFETWPTGEPS